MERGENMSNVLSYNNEQVQTIINDEHQQQQQQVQIGLIQQQAVYYHQCNDCIMRPTCSGAANNEMAEQRGLKRRAPDLCDDSPMLDTIETGQLTQLISAADQAQIGQQQQQQIASSGAAGDQQKSDGFSRAESQHQEGKEPTPHKEGDDKGDGDNDDDDDNEDEDDDDEEEEEEDDGEFNYEPVLSKILNEKKLTLANCPEVIGFLANLSGKLSSPFGSSHSNSSSTSSSAGNNNNNNNNNNNLI